MAEPHIKITGRLDRKLTKTERAKLAATKAGKRTLELLRKKSPIIKARLAKEAPRVKSIAKSIGSAGWELFKMTGAGKRLEKRIKKTKRVARKMKSKSKKTRRR